MRAAGWRATQEAATGGRTSRGDCSGANDRPDALRTNLRGGERKGRIRAESRLRTKKEIIKGASRPHPARSATGRKKKERRRQRRKVEVLPQGGKKRRRRNGPGFLFLSFLKPGREEKEERKED